MAQLILDVARRSDRVSKFPLALATDSVAEIGKTPAGSHSLSSPSVRRSPPVTMHPVHQAAIALTNQTTRYYLPPGIHPLTGSARVPTRSKPTGVRKSFPESLDLLVPSRSPRQHAILPTG